MENGNLIIGEGEEELPCLFRMFIVIPAALGKKEGTIK